MKRFYLPILFIVVLISVIFLIGQPNHLHTIKSKPLNCVIDSVVHKKRYENLPDVVHIYYTNCGVGFYSYKEYNIGDSVSIDIKHINKK